jgi:octaprenyl-diphosphate synthase
MKPAQAEATSRVVPVPDLQSVVRLCADDMRAVNELIRRSLDSNVVLVRQIAEYIIGSGGKRLRPMLAVLSARACGYQGDQHIVLAAVIEFIHTATLLHDDVVDESELRRGKESAHAVWGNAASVLVGDFLYSRAFQMMVDIDSMRVMDVLSDATNQIAEGEVEQLLNMHDPEVSEARYFRVIEKKTAQLFEAACQLGAILAGRKSLENDLARYGRELGSAFQIMDDVLDYASDAATMGKNSGDDLAEGKPTLPLIRCRQKLDATQREAIDEAIRAGDLSKLQWISQAIRDTGALDSSLEAARQLSGNALAALGKLEDSPWKAALETLAEYSISRDH